MKPVSLEDSQVKLPLQIAQLDAERKISITHHKQKFSFPKLTIYAGLKPQLHIHGFGPDRATVHPDLPNRGASA